MKGLLTGEVTGWRIHYLVELLIGDVTIVGWVTNWTQIVGFLFGGVNSRTFYQFEGKLIRGVTN